MKALLGLLKNRWLWLLIALMLIAFVIWRGGPYLSLGDWKPLESSLARAILIALVVVIWVFKRALRDIKAAVAGRRLVKQVARQEDPSSARASADAAKLQQRFAEATATLQKSRKDRTSLYNLPWYIIIGPPGVGKTTALANSGLRFPLARDGKDAKLAGVGGTRNCDWWFTDQAILLDTAGRYTTQDSDQASDAAGWREFLALLRRYRGRRPINGVLLALSVTDLVGQSDAARSAHVEAIRSRLEELGRELKISLPVYVVLTKCDLLAGFSEFFDDLTPEGRAQVWGTTFPIDASRSGDAAQQMGPAFQQLLERLSDRMFLRMDAERDVQRRALIFGFPQQVAGVRRPLLSLIGELFGGGAATHGIWLRGVYFTSGTQEGTPVDRMLGALARTFGLSVKAVDTQNVRGRAYFIQRLLMHVVFHESGLAGINKSVEVRHAAVQAATYGGIAVAALLMMAWMITSYGRNRAYLDETQKAVQPLLTSLPPAAGADLGTRLARLDTYREVLGATDLGGNYRALLGPTDSKGNGVPFLMRAGVYQGNSVSAAAADAYVRELNADLAPAMAGAFHERLTALGGDPDNLYKYLKAYLMLGEPDRLVRSEMQDISDQEWRLRFANDSPSVERLDAHVMALLADKSRVRPVTLDDDLVTRARTSLRQASLPVLMYSSLKLKYASDTAHAIHLDKEIGLGGDSLLMHKNGTPLSEPIPAIYTRTVFQKVDSTGKLEVANDFIRNSWVLGPGVASLFDITSLTNELMGVYEDDYIRAWDRVLADLGPRPRRSPQDLSDMMALLASPSSPLKRLLVVVDDNTNLTKPRKGPADEGGGIVAAGIQTVEKTAAKVTGHKSGAPAGTKVTQHFQALHKLIEPPPGGTPPIDDTMRAIGQIQTQLAAAGSAVGQGSVLTQVATPAQAAAAAQLRVAAKELPQPIAGIVAQIGSASQAETIGQASQELARRYETEVGAECRQLIGNRYPFGSGPGDVALADFGRMFAPGGVYEKFFNDHLAQLVDNTREPWRWKEGAVGIGSSAMLARFQQVDRIRQVFFPPGAQLPTVHFTATPDSLDAAVRRLAVDIDGQSVEYRHGPTRAQQLGWPGPAPGQASVLFEETTGTGPNRAYKGPWAFFHMLDDASLQPQSDVRYAVTLSAGGRSARVMLEASSVRNPFGRNELRGFRCSG